MIKINFYNARFYDRKLIKNIFEKAMQATSNEVDNVVVTIKFVSEDEIRILNTKFRKIEKVTDVLSFPMLEIKEPQKLKAFENERDMDGYLYIGDIAICKKKAKKQAKEFGNSYKREVSFLALHGLLHLLGYDHIEKNDEKKMMNLAEKILAEFNIERGGNV